MLNYTCQRQTLPIIRHIPQAIFRNLAKSALVAAKFAWEYCFASEKGSAALLIVNTASIPSE